MKKPTRDTWIMLGVALVMVAGATLGVYWRQGRQMDALSAKTIQLKDTLESQVSKVGGMSSLIHEVQSLKMRYHDFDRKLPKRQELHEFLREINGSLSNADLSNQSIEPGSPTREEDFHTLPIIMKFHGSYLALASMLDHLEKMERLSRVQKLVIGSEEKSADLNIELQMNIYFTES